MKGKFLSWETLHAFARDLGAWLGLTTPVDRVVNELRGYSEDDVRDIVNGARNKINALLRKLDSDYEAHVEQYEERMNNIPFTTSSIVQKAINQHTQKLRDEMKEVRKKYGAQRQEYEQDLQLADSLTLDPVRATSEMKYANSLNKKYPLEQVERRLRDEK